MIDDTFYDIPGEWPGWILMARQRSRQGTGWPIGDAARKCPKKYDWFSVWWWFWWWFWWFILMELIADGCFSLIHFASLGTEGDGVLISKQRAEDQAAFRGRLLCLFGHLDFCYFWSTMQDMHKLPQKMENKDIPGLLRSWIFPETKINLLQSDKIFTTRRLAHSWPGWGWCEICEAQKLPKNLQGLCHSYGTSKKPKGVCLNFC